MSTLTVSNVSDGTLSIPTTYVTNGSAKAWVNFNGTGTIAARDSLNVSSLTDNGTGDYTVNLTSSMASTNNAELVSSSVNQTGLTTLPAASSIRIFTQDSSGNQADTASVNGMKLGDLA